MKVVKQQIFRNRSYFKQCTNTSRYRTKLQTAIYHRSLRYKHGKESSKIPGHKFKPETTSFLLGYDPKDTTLKSIKAPVYLSSTFAFSDAKTGAQAFAEVYGIDGNEPSRATPYIYSRVNNPNMMLYEERLAAWDNTEHCLLFSSGMSAISTLFLSLLKPNDHILLSKPIYGGTYAFAEKLLPLFKINAHFFDCGSNAIESINEIIENDIGTENLDKVKLIFCETPSNPSNQHTDIAQLSELKKARFSEDCMLMIDNTFLGPLFQSPMDHGADGVLYSATKFLGGHSDLIAGAISCNNEYLYGSLSVYRTLLGTMSQPFISWLLTRSMETLGIRMERAQSNAIELAENVLDKHAIVENVRYSTLLDWKEKEGDCGQCNIYKKQCKGSGSVITFDIVSDKNIDDVYKVCDSVEIFTLAVSLGGTESLIEHPQSMTHADTDSYELSKKGITKNTIRLSVGIEHIDDLKMDLIHALNTICSDEQKMKY